MAVNLSDKRIIMIHGLASKPPQDDVHDLWRKCLIENIRVNNKTLAKALDANPQVFVSAYWADATPYHIPDDKAYVNKLRVQVDKVIQERQTIKGKFHVGTGEKVADFFKDRGLDLAKVITGALRVKDDVMKTFLQETRLYSEDQFIADKMRTPLEQHLRDAWDDKCKVALLSHSMGSFISYDVLWRFSHRNTPGYKKYRNKIVEMFVTMGSPLGEPAVQDLLFAHYHKARGKREFPTNTRFWHNYSCLGDVVSHQENFNEIYFDKMRALNLFPKNKKFRAIDYVNLHNPFEVVTHKGNKDKPKRNPHKSYGYLVQPRLGTWLIDFLNDNLK